MKAELRGNPTSAISLQNASLFITPSTQLQSPVPRTNFSKAVTPLSGALKGCLGSLDGACIEKLLLHCASTLESNDGTLAQQVMWVLNNVASLVGDPNQRLTAWFLRALISRASKVCPTTMSLDGSSSALRRRMTVTELAGYVDLIPWHRFGFRASNSAIFKAIEGHAKVHILDFSITHCMQWPTLIDALAKRPQGPPSVRISVPSYRPLVSPLLNVSSEEVGQRLANFARFQDVPFEFNLIDDDHSSNLSGDQTLSHEFRLQSLMSQLTPCTLDLREDEALVVNFQNWVRFLSDEPKGSNSPHETSLRDAFLDTIKELNPSLILIVDEDSDLSAPSLTSRITDCFNYLWIPFDALETLLPKTSPQRIDYESDIGSKIESIISFEGPQRIERLESGVGLSQRMKNIGFVSLPFGEETVREVKFLLDEHASGWGMKREEDMLVLTWKGHNSVFATAWTPPCLEEYQQLK